MGSALFGGSSSDAWLDGSNIVVRLFINFVQVCAFSHAIAELSDSCREI